jgi:hypothetical protein
VVWLGFTSEGGYETASALLVGNVMIPRTRSIRTADIPSQWRTRNKELEIYFTDRTLTGNPGGRVLVFEVGCQRAAPDVSGRTVTGKPLSNFISPIAL